AHLPGSRRAAARAIRNAEGEGRGRREGGTRERARLRAGGAQVLLYAQRRLGLDACAQGRARPRGRSRDGVQPQRLRRTALGRGGEERRGRDLQAARARGTAREDDAVPRLVPRTAPPAARITPRVFVG